MPSQEESVSSNDVHEEKVHGILVSRKRTHMESLLVAVCSPTSYPMHLKREVSYGRERGSQFP